MSYEKYSYNRQISVLKILKMWEFFGDSFLKLFTFDINGYRKEEMQTFSL